MMAYYFNTMLPGPFDEAVARTVAALKEEAFGIITEIDVQKTLHEKIGVAFRKYRILGACNPKLAHEALQLEDKIGTTLPCNVVVQELADGRVEVAATRWRRAWVESRGPCSGISQGYPAIPACAPRRAACASRSRVLQIGPRQSR